MSTQGKWQVGRRCRWRAQGEAERKIGNRVGEDEVDTGGGQEVAGRQGRRERGRETETGTDREDRETDTETKREREREIERLND